ncbi:MAG: cytochrome-c oxidase [Rhodospirillales bacterium]|jgi:cytochrome c oxidase subunit 2|nr:cytochrome-c oxidase [Rhodospirillales bacterium]
MRHLLQWPALCAGGGLLAVGAVGIVAVAAVAAPAAERTVSVTVMKFEFIPDTINLKKGEPVVVDLSSLDRRHGFNVPELGLRTDVLPDESVKIRLVPDKAGRFLFRCDNFCGDGHEDMQGVIVVSE